MKVDFYETKLTRAGKFIQEKFLTVTVESGKSKVVFGKESAAKGLGIESVVKDEKAFLNNLHKRFSGSRVRAGKPY